MLVAHKLILDVSAPRKSDLRSISLLNILTKSTLKSLVIGKLDALIALVIGTALETEDGVQVVVLALEVL